MPTVEWAETSAVSRVAQPLREKPEQSGDVFAAMFDSARRSISARADRAVREQQRTIRGDSKDAAASGQASAHDRATTKATGKARETEKQRQISTDGAPEGKTDPPLASDETQKTGPHAEARDSEKPRPLEDTRVSADAGQPDPADDSQPAGELAVQPDPQPAAVPEDGDARAAETSGEVPAAPEAQQPFVPEALSASQEPTVQRPAQAGSSAGEAIVESAGAAMKLLLSPREGQADGVQKDAATAAPDTTDAASVQPGDQETGLSSLSVWQILRGIAAHLEQVVAPVSRAEKDAVPSVAGSKQATSGEATVRSAGSQATTATLAATLDSRDAALMHEDGKSGKEQNSGGDAARTSSDAARPADAGPQHNAIVDAFRGLLDAAGRVRDSIASPDSQAAPGLVGRSLDGRGVNLGEARAINDLAEVVRANIGPRNSSMLLRLDPPELGQLRIDVRMQGQELMLRLQADTLEGHDALRSRLQELRSSLEQHGFKLSQLDVELRVPQSPSTEPHQDRSSQQSQWDGQAWHQPGWQGETHGGTDASADSESSNENSAFSQEDASKGEGHDGAGRLAETGVDLVV